MVVYLFGIRYNTEQSLSQDVVLDTNILIFGFRSKRGASYKLLKLIDSGLFKLNASLPLVVEYEAILSRECFCFSQQEISQYLDYICTVSERKQIYFLWRPLLKDPKDDMVLELAVTGECQYIVSFNKKDFQGSEKFGVSIITPQKLLKIIGAIP